MKVLKSSFEITSEDTNQPGFIITDQKKILKIKCKDGYIQLLTIKPEGKKVMEVHEFLNGHKVFNIN
jgi:methionyl-tRNA formyltransferase